jgi:DNA (cytosine-5)-methyltransferase 1
MKPTFGSLFAGVGGFDMGMEQAGWNCKFQVEWDKHCRSVLDRHWPDVEKWSDVRNINGRFLPPVDCIIFGSPCQDLSKAGKREGLSGATAGTFPRWAIWENVAGSLDSNKGADFGQVLDSMAEAGAVVIEWKLLDSKYFGKPQVRRRVFVVFGFISDSRNPSACKIFPILESSKGNIQKGNTVAFYRSHGRLDQFGIGVTPPLKTVSTVCVVGETLRPRELTPLECERLQGYPDDHTRWAADGTELSDAQRFKQVGNGVTTPVAKWVGEQLIAAHLAVHSVTPMIHT